MTNDEQDPFIGGMPLMDVVWATLAGNCVVAGAGLARLVGLLRRVPRRHGLMVNFLQ